MPRGDCSKDEEVRAESFIVLDGVKCYHIHVLRNQRSNHAKSSQYAYEGQGSRPHETR